MAKKNVARQLGVVYTINMAAPTLNTAKEDWSEYSKEILHYEGISNIPEWGWYSTGSGGRLLLADNEVKVKRFSYKLYNRYSDAICEVMEEDFGIGSLWTRLERRTDFYTPIFKDEHVEVALDILGMKETFFGFLHIVDDETFDAIIAELKKED